MKLQKYTLYAIYMSIALLFTSCSSKQIELENINSEVTLQDMAYILEDYIDKADANAKTEKENQKEISLLKEQLANSQHKISTNSKEIDILNIKVQNLRQETKDSIINYIKSNNLLQDKITLNPKTITIDPQDVVLDDYVPDTLVESDLDNTFVEPKIEKSFQKPKKIKSNTNNKYKLARVYVPQGVVVKRTAQRESKTITHYPQNSILKIKSCDRFGWCKLYGERGYVTHFLLNFKRLNP